MTFEHASLGACLTLLVGCASSAPPTTPTTTPAPDSGAPAAVEGKTFPTAAEAPKYDGTAFAGMQIFDAEKEVYLDEDAFILALGEARLTFFGEQHETAPVQELELWVLTRMTAKYDDVSLAMEHFQRDEQPVLDDYIAGKTTSDAFEKSSQPWKSYAVYWKPLVEHMKSKGRPVVGLNVPDEALETIYAGYPKSPLQVFNAFPSTFKYDASIAPRPIAAGDAVYKGYFAANFDASAHSGMGMTKEETLAYFTELAVIRDETMAYFAADELGKGGRVMTVAGDFHVQTGLATPDRAARYGGEGTTYRLVSTTTTAKLEQMKKSLVGDRHLARFWLVYGAK